MKLGMNYGIMLLAASAGLAVAQPTYKGTFNLPFETYWGGSVLPPGDYTVSIESLPMGAQVLRARGPNGVAGALIGPSEAAKFTDKGRLVLEDYGGVYALKRYDAAMIGKSYEFSLPKSINGKVSSKSNEARPQATVISTH